MNTIILATQLGIVIILVGLYIKMRKMHLAVVDIKRKTKQCLTNVDPHVFRQFESLLGLYKDLGFQKSLPPTRGWAGSPDFLQALAEIILKKRPALVVECSSGVSTLIVARCLQLVSNGRVVSLDHDLKYANKTIENVKAQGLVDYAQVIHAPLQRQTIGHDDWLWYDRRQWEQLDGIDVIVIDGPPMGVNSLARYPAGPNLFVKLNKGGIVILDDASRDDEKEIVKRWLVEYAGMFSVEEIDCPEKGCIVMTKL